MKSNYNNDKIVNKYSKIDQIKSIYYTNGSLATSKTILEYLLRLSFVRNHSINTPISSNIRINHSREMQRDWIGLLKQDKGLVGVEIGVHRGRHAKYLTDNLDIKKLYLIDPYETYDKHTRRHYRKTISDAEKSAKSLLKNNKVKFIRKMSDDAIQDVPSDLDFVYIDGNHEYEYVKLDIENYYDKIRNGGILCGHDFDLNSKGVVRAVTEFAN
jgi:hypothetical protein